MSSRAIEVSDVQLRAADARDRERGVVAFVGVTVDRWRIDGLTIRRGAQRDFVLVFPARLDGKGRERSYVRPIDDRMRRVIETAVVTELLRRQGESFAAKQGATADVAGARTRQNPRGGGGT